MGKGHEQGNEQNRRNVTREMGNVHPGKQSYKKRGKATKMI